MAKKKKLTNKERAEMPSLFGYSGVIAMQHVEKKHKHKKKYDRRSERKKYYD